MVLRQGQQGFERESCTHCIVLYHDELGPYQQVRGARTFLYMLGYSEVAFAGDVEIGDVVLYLRRTPTPKSCPRFLLNFGTVRKHSRTHALTHKCAACRHVLVVSEHMSEHKSKHKSTHMSERMPKHRYKAIDRPAISALSQHSYGLYSDGRWPI